MLVSTWIIIHHAGVGNQYSCGFACSCQKIWRGQGWSYTKAKKESRLHKALFFSSPPPPLPPPPHTHNQQSGGARSTGNSTITRMNRNAVNIPVWGLATNTSTFMHCSVTSMLSSSTQPAAHVTQCLRAVRCLIAQSKECHSKRSLCAVSVCCYSTLLQYAVPVCKECMHKHHLTCAAGKSASHVLQNSANTG